LFICGKPLRVAFGVKLVGTNGLDIIGTERVNDFETPGGLI
jgi:hypothetical protein